MKKYSVLSVLAVIVVSFLFSFIGETEATKLTGSDKYKVIRVDGRIVFIRTNADMKKGDVFLQGTTLKFKTQQSRAAVISSIKGRFVLSASEKGQTKILPAANNISSRDASLLNKKALEDHFKGKYLVLDRLTIEIGEKSYPMDENNFFYVMYDYEGTKVRKVLSSMEGNLLVLDKNEIYKIDGKPIEVDNKEMQLYYRKDGESFKISDFQPIFPDLDELKEEVQIIVDEFGSKSDEIKTKEINGYLSQFYGDPHVVNFYTWLENEFGIESILGTAN